MINLELEDEEADVMEKALRDVHISLHNNEGYFNLDNNQDTLSLLKNILWKLAHQGVHQ